MQTYVGRNDFVGIGRIVDVVFEVLHQVDLGSIFVELLLVTGSFLQSQLGIAGQVGQAGTLLEACQSIFCTTQFLINNGDTFFDELSRLLSYFVLFVVGILVIYIYQAIDEVHTALLDGILDIDLSNGGSLGSRGYAHVGTIAGCCCCRSADSSCEGYRFSQSDGGIRREGQYTDFGWESGRQLLDVGFDFLLFLVLGISYLYLQLAIGTVVHLYLYTSLELVGFFRTHVYLHRLVLIERLVIAETAVLAVVDVEFQIGHYLLNHGV